MTDSDEIAEAGRYDTLHEASEYALVILAAGGSYWLFEDNDDWVLYTTVADLPRMREELAAYERERTVFQGELDEVPVDEGKVSPLSLILYGWGLGLFFLVTRADPDRWTTLGAASGSAILEHGEWWRTVTALTLHSDFSHVAGNIAFGILFAVFLIPLLGTGATWFLILASGAAGNAVNAVFYQGSGHTSIGASTAVFGALGLLVGCRIQLALRVDHPFRTLASRLVVPLGAGLALLAFLGTGGQRTDYLAHLWGFLVGLPLGVIAMALRSRDRFATGMQLLLGAAALAVCLFSWLLAISDAGRNFPVSEGF